MAAEYMGHCLCSAREIISFGLGIASVIAWVVAEIPQIITNYKRKTGEGLSLSFLFFWIVGKWLVLVTGEDYKDLFNLFGCKFETETLPTQYYTALLYTIITVTLTLQTIYYDHIYQRLKSRRESPQVLVADATEEKEGLVDTRNYGSAVVEGESIRSSPISLPLVPDSYSAAGGSFYMSARSLSTSHTPPQASLGALARKKIMDTENTVEEPLLDGSIPAKATPANLKTILCLVSVVTFLGGSYGTPSIRKKNKNMVFSVTSQLGRKFLQESGQLLTGAAKDGNSSIGTYMGWAMAVIYMGGRFPQIHLNIRRGHVEGLNPLLFMFALVGNITYLASILVNSLQWSKLKPNLPWLVEAGGCTLLDSFILCQFVYFSHSALKKNRKSKQEVDHV